MKKSRSIALGGMMSALTLVVLSLGLILNFNELFFLLIASFCGVATILLTDQKTAFLSYVVVSILSVFLLSGNIGMMMLYITLFGIYPFAKLFIEIINNPPVEFLLKLIFLNVGMLITFLVYSKLFVNIFAFKFGVVLAIIVLQILYIVYDYALTTFVVFFNSSLKRIKKSK